MEWLNNDITATVSERWIIEFAWYLMQIDLESAAELDHLRLRFVGEFSFLSAHLLLYKWSTHPTDSIGWNSA